MPPKTSGKAAKKSGKAQKNISKSDKKRRSTRGRRVTPSTSTSRRSVSPRALQQTFDDNIEGGADPVRLLLPGELAKHAVSEGTKAVTKYTSSGERERLRAARRGYVPPLCSALLCARCDTSYHNILSEHSVRTDAPARPLPVLSLNKHFICAFYCADRCPAVPRDPPGPTDRESNHWLPNGVNEVICSVTRALAFPLQGTANPDGPGTTGLGGCSSPIPGVARPPSTSSLTPSFPVCWVYSRPSSDTELIPLFAHLRAELREAGPRRSLFAPANNRHPLSTCVGC
ncbi:Histone H2B [Eumeta japonica]|uniref:Histone H2B n=1 Tax=Eumeta variegata TaxID=151549 RepID=A0A4C1ZMC1_EUMVA|nr:Histone H2B [Eumeta japonica]